MQRATHQIGHLIIFFASFFYSWFVSGVVSFLLLCFAFELCRDAVNITHASCVAAFQSCAAFKRRSFLFTFQIVLFQYSYSYLLFTFCMKNSINLSGWCMNLNLLMWIGRIEKESEREREKLINRGNVLCTPFRISCAHTMARYRSRWQTKIFEHRMANSSHLVLACLALAAR